MMVILSVLLTVLCLPCLNGQALESIPSTSVLKKSGEALSLSCRGTGFTFSLHGMHWIRQPAGKALEWIGTIWSDASKTIYISTVEGRIEITRDNSNSMAYLRLSNLKPEDTAVYYCARERGGADYWGKGTTVTVTSDTPNAPTVFPLMQCGSGTGDMVTLGCLATGFTPSSLTYSWSVVNGDALTDFIQYPPVLKDNLYSGVSQIRVRRQDWDANKSFKCDVAHAAGNQHVIMGKPKVYYKLPTLKVMSCSDQSTETTFSCIAKDFAPKDFEFKWLKNQEEITNGITKIKSTFDERNTENGTLYSAASFLTVPSTEMAPGITFTCEFTGKGEKGPAYVNSSVTDPIGGDDPVVSTPCMKADVDIKIIEPTMEDFVLHGKGNVKCQVTINKPSVQKIYWETHNGKSIPDAVPEYPPAGKKGDFTAVLPITFDEWRQGAKFICIVEHEDWIEPRKETYKKTIGGLPQRPSVFMLPPIEHAKTETVTLTCYVKDFFPKEVFVSWLVDDEEADSKYKFHTTTPVENGGSYSAYGQLTLTLEQWKNDDMVYSCAVHHESVVNTTRAIVRSIGHRTFERTNMVNLNMNIPETCKAQ